MGRCFDDRVQGRSLFEGYGGEGQDNRDAAESRRQVVISLNKTRRGKQRSLKQEMYDDGCGIQVVPETGEAF